MVHVLLKPNSLSYDVSWNYSSGNSTSECYLCLGSTGSRRRRRSIEFNCRITTTSFTIQYLFAGQRFNMIYPSRWNLNRKHCVHWDRLIRLGEPITVHSTTQTGREDAGPKSSPESAWSKVIIMKKICPSEIEEVLDLFSGHSPPRTKPVAPYDDESPE